MCKFCIKLWKTGTLPDPFEPKKNFRYPAFLYSISFFSIFQLSFSSNSLSLFLKFYLFLAILLRKIWLIFYFDPLHLQLFLLLHLLLLFLFLLLLHLLFFFLLIRLLLLPIHSSSFASSYSLLYFPFLRLLFASLLSNRLLFHLFFFILHFFFIYFLSF